MIVEANGSIPLKIWATDLEEGALEQARNLVELPFAFKYVAIMADGHRGYGMPIGGVLATTGVVVPNAVGLDIGCFSGETLIPLLDGTQRSLRELTDSGEDIWVYSLDATGKLVPGRATPKLTRHSAEFICVEITGGAKVVCTPDHPFMLKDGSYRQAAQLKIDDSLTPLYRTYTTREGYESAITRTGKAVRTHKMVATAVYGTISKGFVIHHINGKRTDNRPENLVVLTIFEHGSLHQHIGKHRFTEDWFKEKRLAALHERGFYAPELAQKKHDVAVANITTYMRENPEHFADSVKGNGERGAQYLRSFNEINNATEYTCEWCGRKILGKGGYHKHLKSCAGVAQRQNHKVVSVTSLTRRDDAYCLSVAEHNNFALAAGVFVHNCGMRAWSTGVAVEDFLPVRDAIMQQLRLTIPVGFSWHQKPQDDANLFWDAKSSPAFPVISANHDKALLQLGTLGGGNHFVEIQKDENGTVWAMVHSGSRNLGKQVADHYNKMAVQLNTKWHSAVPKAWELAFLPLDSEEGQLYMAEMLLCLSFAKLNRQRMMEAVKQAFDHELGARELLTEDIDIHHNYAALENHYGKNVLVHRKGAVKAVGTVIIPGSMGSHSYIAKGLENPDSFKSCSHGAGRAMGRKAAIRDLPVEPQAEEMRERDIKLFGGGRGNEWVAESKLAYKAIDEVMENQKDLVQPLIKLIPLAVLKA